MPEHNYRIYVDATADFHPSLSGRMAVLPMRIGFGGECLEYAADWDAARLAKFYGRLRRGEMPATSQITPFGYEQAFEKALRDGQDVLYLGFSSNLSNSLSSAQIAAAALAQRYPDRRVVVYDTLSATFALGLLLERALDNQLAGMSLDRNVADLDEEGKHGVCWFTVSDLMYLRHGGRISAAAAVIGTTLRIMPILCIDEEGRLPVIDKVQGRKTAIRALVRRFQATVDRPETQNVCVIQADAMEEAQLLDSMVRQAVPQVGGTFIGDLGPVVGAHTGPGTLGLVYRVR